MRPHAGHGVSSDPCFVHGSARGHAASDPGRACAPAPGRPGRGAPLPAVSRHCRPGPAPGRAARRDPARTGRMAAGGVPAGRARPLDRGVAGAAVPAAAADRQSFPVRLSHARAGSEPGVPLAGAAPSAAVRGHPGRVPGVPRADVRRCLEIPRHPRVELARTGAGARLRARVRRRGARAPSRPARGDLPVRTDRHRRRGARPGREPARPEHGPARRRRADGGAPALPPVRVPGQGARVPPAQGASAVRYGPCRRSPSRPGSPAPATLPRSPSCARRSRRWRVRPPETPDDTIGQWTARQAGADPPPWTAGICAAPRSGPGRDGGCGSRRSGTGPAGCSGRSGSAQGATRPSALAASLDTAGRIATRDAMRPAGDRAPPSRTPRRAGRSRGPE